MNTESAIAGSVDQLVLARGIYFTNTETTRPAMSAAKGKAGESPKGLGWDGNKPLMRNRTAMCAIPDRYLPPTL